jgi:hypothetical protein
MGERWKREERRVARLLGGQRIPRLGRPSPDVVTPWLSVEQKDRLRVPNWLYDGLARARSQAKRGQLGVLTITSKKTRQGLVVLDLLDFRDWFIGGRGRAPLHCQRAGARKAGHGISGEAEGNDLAPEGTGGP